MTDAKNVPTLVAQFSMFAVRFHTDIQYSWAWAEYLPTGLQYHFETAKCRATRKAQKSKRTNKVKVEVVRLVPV
jgi:hypothetical protein